MADDNVIHVNFAKANPNDAFSEEVRAKLYFADITGVTVQALDFASRILYLRFEEFRPLLRERLKAGKPFYITTNYGVKNTILFAAIPNVNPGQLTGFLKLRRLPPTVESVYVGMTGGPATTIEATGDVDDFCQEIWQQLASIITDGQSDGFPQELFSALACIYDGDYLPA